MVDYDVTDPATIVRPNCGDQLTHRIVCIAQASNLLGTDSYWFQESGCELINQSRFLFVDSTQLQ